MTLPDQVIRPPSVRSRLDAYPEWWLGLVAAVGWSFMWPHLITLGRPCHRISLAADFRDWMYTVAAMMIPQMSNSVRWTADRSLRRRQNRAMAEFIAGYLVLWALAGLGVVTLMGSRAIRTEWMAALIFALAGLYALTPFHRVASVARHALIPLAPTGLRADWDCLRLGTLQGIGCVASCLPLMLGCTASGHGLVAMLGGTAIGVSELRSGRRRRHIQTIGCVALSAFYALAAWLH